MTALSAPATWPAAGAVRLRPFGPADVDMLRDLATDPYVPLIGTLPAQADEAAALAYIERQHERWTSGAGYSYCIADAATDAALGGAGLWLGGLAAGRASAGYSVAPRARRRGVAADALAALTTFGWTLPELHRIELFIEPWNVGSQRTAERAGYRREGLLRQHQEIDGRRVDVFIYASLRSDQP